MNPVKKSKISFSDTGRGPAVNTFGDSDFEEKKEDHYSYKNSKRNKTPRSFADKRMANGKDIWNNVGVEGEASLAVQDPVHVNLAMADLMAYLQVVANNSNHLPLTRRDDPELDRSITTLTAEDYARKSAAFVPADVRVLGGVFSRHGRVWDLPTSTVSLSPAFPPSPWICLSFSNSP